MQQDQSSLSIRSQATKKATLVGAIVNLFLTIIKLAAGFLANSAALVADGVHSLSDLLSDGLVWFTANTTAEGPDEEHPYGHGRFETATTLGLGILLILVAVGIIWDGIGRTLDGAVSVPGQLALWAAFISILSKEALYWYTLIVGKKINSSMLIANAWHHRSDAISSVVVLVGIAGSMMGWVYLDTIAAIVVGIIVAKVGWDLAISSVEELVDTALDEESVTKAYATIMEIPGVNSVHMLRTRTHGQTASADVHVQVDPRITVSEGHRISHAVEDILIASNDIISDVIVHIDPEDDEQVSSIRQLPLRVEVEEQLKTLWPKLPMPYSLNLHYLSGKIDIDLILPVALHDSKEEHARLCQELEEALSDTAHFQSLRILYQ